MAWTQCGIPLLGGFSSKENYLILVQIAWQCSQRSTWNVLPRVTTSWGFNTALLNIISKLFDRTTSQWKCNFLCRNCQLASPTWAIMRDLTRCTWSEHLNVKMVSKISKFRPTRQIIKLSVIHNTRWVKTVTFSHRKSLSQRNDTWQPTDREGTMPSWTEPTVDQLIIRFNARESSNYDTLK